MLNIIDVDNLICVVFVGGDVSSCAHLRSNELFVFLGGFVGEFNAIPICVPAVPPS